MSWQLSCYDMCKIGTWSNQDFFKLKQHEFLQDLDYEYINTLNTLRPRQNGRHFADDIFKRILFNVNVWISIKISLKFVPKSPINKIPALFQIMAWRRPGNKPLSEAMLVSLLTHKCVTQPQWVNEFLEVMLGQLHCYPTTLSLMSKVLQ